MYPRPWHPLIALFLLAGLLSGCRETPTPPERLPPQKLTVEVAPGVRFQQDRSAGVALLEVDLTTAKVKPAVVAAKVEKKRNNYLGDCKTVPEWLEATGALAGINAGFFGKTYDAEGRRKQYIGLLVQNGAVTAPARFVYSTRHPGEKFLRSAIGFDLQGTPDITWASGEQNALPRRHNRPVNPTGGEPWRVRSAVACGPALFAEGKRRITDREERLVSPGKLARAFIAFDLKAGKPHHLIFGCAEAMEFTEVADYLEAFFRGTYGTVPAEGMFLDGGASAQVAYRDPASGAITDALPTGVLVPTAIVLLP